MPDFADPPQGGGILRRSQDPRMPSGTTNGSRPRVVVCSDIRLLHEGIALAVAQDGRLEVVGAVKHEDAPAMVAAQRPDVVLLDAGISSGRSLPRVLKEISPDLRIVIFALADGEVDVVGWVEAGVDGYVGRDGTLGDLTSAVDGVLRGEAFCSPRLVRLLFARVAQLSVGAAPNAGTGGLTPREQEVMKLLEQGLPNKEIARRLGIASATVKNHVHRILEKMQARGRNEAAARVRRLGQPSPDPNPAIRRGASAD